MNENHNKQPTNQQLAIKISSSRHHVYKNDDQFLQPQHRNPFTLKKALDPNIQMFDGHNNVRMSLARYHYDRFSGRNELIGYSGFMFDVDCRTDDELSSLTEFNLLMSKYGFIVQFTGGGFHYYAIFDKYIVKDDSYELDMIKSLIVELRNNVKIFDKQCNPFGNIRPLGSFRTDRNCIVQSIHYSEAKKNVYDWYSTLIALKQELRGYKFFTTNKTVVCIEPKRTIKINSNTYSSKPKKINLKRYIDITMNELPRNNYKQATSLDYFMNINIDDPMYKQKQRINNKILKSILVLFQQEFKQHKRNSLLYRLLGMLSQQGLREVKSFQLIFEYLEKNGIVFTKDCNHRILRHIRSILKGKFNFEYAKEYPVLKDIGRSISNMKRNYISYYTIDKVSTITPVQLENNDTQLYTTYTRGIAENNVCYGFGSPYDNYIEDSSSKDILLVYDTS